MPHKAQTLREIVKFALQMEEDGHKLYLELKEKSTHPLGKRLFTGLAEDEVQHAALLRKVYSESGIAEVRKAVQDSLSGPPREVFRTIFLEARDEARTRAAAEPKAAETPQAARLRELYPEAGLRAERGDLEALNIAMDMEKRAYELYREAAESATSHEAKVAFEHLALMEDYHTKVLQETEEYLVNTEDWYMENEGWNFEGA